MTFEKYLKEEFEKDYDGEDLGSDFDEWLYMELGTYELMEYAEDWHKYLILQNK